MILPNSFEIKRYEFSSDLTRVLSSEYFAKDLWPIVYIISDGNVKEAYVGETTDVDARMTAHLKNQRKKTLTTVHLISSVKFNKSATLDIESNLIKYISGDGVYTLLNGNLGLANHTYFQKRELYWDTFRSIWNKLRGEGITEHSIEYIDNSDLFKYSPYKTLSKDQKDGLLAIINSLLSESYKNTIVQGGAGTGKTILALFLSKILKSPYNSFNFREFQEVEEFTDPLSELRVKFPDPKIGLVVPMASFRNTLKKVFKNVKGLNSSMVIGPAEVVKQKYDILIVDEAHRLRRRINLGTYFGSFDSACEKLGLDKASCSELDWVLLQSRKCILFYDEAQSIKPSDAKTEDFQKLKNSPNTTLLGLKSQLRVNGGNDYVEFVNDLLDCRLATINQFQNNEEFEVLLFESIDDLVSEIKTKESQYGLSRLVAGYSWEWVSKGDDTKTMTDIEIEGTRLRWNSVASDWITSEGAIDEVGCIHTTQGYDLNYIGVIFGNEITYNPIKKEIEVIKENYFDRNGKMSINNIEQLRAYIINIYKTIMLRGIRGAYVYICDAELRKYMAQYIPEALHHKKPPLRILTQDEAKPFENCIPIYNLRAAAGNFSESQKVDELDWLELPSDLHPKTDMFACQVVGRSMNVVIPDGAICLFRRYQGGSRNGKIVLVESTSLQDADTGSSYTVKEYHSSKTIDGDGWQHNSITLKPLSDDPNYTDIVLATDAAQQLRVIGVFERVLDS
ncbi:MAG: DUF2075 domain-containing protein [Imperialibacter sp.]|uniref:DNA/RNA helicase domain-containing protein n=1 Tax=Imperialibacter sp. TaxID=2038411 RepID=UPI0032EB74D4